MYGGINKKYNSVYMFVSVWMIDLIFLSWLMINDLCVWGSVNII